MADDKGGLWLREAGSSAAPSVHSPTVLPSAGHGILLCLLSLPWTFQALEGGRQEMCGLNKLASFS